MDNTDFHPKCQHCLPLVPPSDLSEKDQEAMKIDLCHGEAKREQSNRDYKRHYSDQLAFQELQRKKKEEKLLQKKDKEGTPTSLFMTRRVPRKLTVTGLTDKLLREVLNNDTAYANGTRERIIDEVLKQFPGTEQKKVAALFYSRRAILKKEALVVLENEVVI